MNRIVSLFYTEIPQPKVTLSYDCHTHTHTHTHLLVLFHGLIQLLSEVVPSNEQVGLLARLAPCSPGLLIPLLVGATLPCLLWPTTLEK